MINLTSIPYCGNFNTTCMESDYFKYFDSCLSTATVDIIINKLLDFLYRDDFFDNCMKKASDIVLSSKNICPAEDLFFKTNVWPICGAASSKDLGDNLDRNEIKGFGTKFNNIMARFFLIEGTSGCEYPIIFHFNSSNYTCIDIFFEDMVANPEFYEGAFYLIIKTIDAMFTVALAGVNNQQNTVADITTNCWTNIYLNVPFNEHGLKFTMDYYYRLFHLLNNVYPGHKGELLYETFHSVIDLVEDTDGYTLHNRTMNRNFDFLATFENKFNYPVDIDFKRFLIKLYKNEIADMTLDEITEFSDEIFRDTFKAADHAYMDFIDHIQGE